MSSHSDAVRPSAVANRQSLPTRNLSGGSPSATSATTPQKIRARHACNRCQTLRLKCSGGNRCERCIKDDVNCTYSARKQERTRRSLVENAERISYLENEKRLLIEALTEVVQKSTVRTKQTRHAIDLLASMANEPQEELSSNTTSPNLSTDSSSFKKGPPQLQATSWFGEKDAPSSVGSPGKQGELQHVLHLDHGSGMTGFIGKMSEVSWMQRAREHLIGEPAAIGSDATPATLDLHTAQAFDLNYFMDNEDILSVDEELVDAQQLPSPTTALVLCEAYFHALQGAFCFVRRELMLQLLDRAFVDPKVTTWAGRRTMGLINVVWAVGAKWLDDVCLDRDGIAEHHSTYYARARALGLDHRIQFDHPDVQMTQAMGILAFYLTINGSIQRAWGLLGQAIRHTTALGLNLRVTPDVIDSAASDDRAFLAYSLYQHEVLLAEITGRAMCIHNIDYTLQIHLVSPFRKRLPLSPNRVSDSSIEAKSRSLWQSFLASHRANPLNVFGGGMPWDSFMPVGSEVSPDHFTCRLALSTISEEIGAKLYSGVTSMSWFDHQRETRTLEEKLQKWLEELPPELQIDYTGQSNSDPRSRLELAMYHHSIRMILWRPCLCEITIEDESETSARFNREGAGACIQSALKMLDMMPHTGVLSQIFQILPWWAVLHYICQAAAVLLLELSLDMQHIQDERTRITLALKKGLELLRVLAQHSKSGYKAWNIVQCLFDKTLKRHSIQASPYIATSIPKPWNWTEGDEMRIEIVRQTLR